MAVINGNERDNQLTGKDKEADTISGLSGNDTVYGKGGDDTLYGGGGMTIAIYPAPFDGHDRLFGDSGNDIAFGGTGDDYIDGGKHNDQLFGEDGNDTLLGGEGHDVMHGGLGNDIMRGQSGNDQLFGGAGHDVIDGGDGDDIIRASRSYYDAYESEYDVLTGGKGKDVFVMTDEFGNPAYLNDDVLNPDRSTGFALIKDFQASQDTKKDTIELDGYAAHYRLMSVSWGQEFGRADTAAFEDVALVYIGSEQDKQDVVAVLQDVSTQFISNSAGYLNNPNVFTFV